MAPRGSVSPPPDQGRSDNDVAMDMLPLHEPPDGHDRREKPANSPSASAGGGGGSGRDKIRCLDGLRGVACLLVFNYHFLWPWTPSIMLGHGATHPGAVEPYNNWASLPIVCLLHRGRPMVAIFFAISGYVVCRHILRAIHDRRIDAAYRSLASASLRRAFRLYIPPTISMLLVALLAQMGAFRSEDDIYKGPDSAYINGTVTMTELGGPCARGISSAVGASGVARYLGLDSPDYLANVTGWTQHLCLNSTSQQFGPASVYANLADPADAQIAKMSNRTRGLETYALQVYIEHGVHDYEHDEPYNGPVPRNVVGRNVTSCKQFKFVQMGGMWEEHPLIHDNATYAMQNFTRVYMEWVNPFNFGHYHPRYDPHAFTIPMEFRGSLVLYIFLLATAAIKARWRMGIAGAIIAYCLTLGRWDVAGFMGGMASSEWDIRHSFHPWHSDGPPDHADFDTRRDRRRSSNGGALGGLSGRQAAAARWVVMFVALYFLSYPDAAAEYTPGYRYLSTWVPRYYIPLSGWMFYQSMGAVMLLPCVLREPVLRRLLESRVPQLLGKISFSLYLVHGPVLHSVGFWVMPRLFDHFGRTGGYLVGWVSLLSLTLYLSTLWYKHVDTWSTGVGRKVERFLTD